MQDIKEQITSISLEDVIQVLRSKISHDIEIDVYEVVDTMPSLSQQDTLKLSEWLSKNDLCTKLQFKSAMEIRKRKDYLLKHLGFVPVDCADFVLKFAAHNHFTLTLVGDLQCKAPIILDDHIVTAIDRKIPDIDKRARLIEAQTDNMEDFRRKLRLARDKFLLKFSDTAIVDAATQWEKDVLQAKRCDMMLGVIYTKGLATGPAGQAMWQDMERAAFNVTEDPEGSLDSDALPFGMPTAIIKKMMWQVKRKAFNYPVTDHLMPVITGKQGGGKSSFVKAFYEPLADAVCVTDFRTIGDDRIIDMWASPILFIDEMSGASKTDIDIVKHIITADNVQRRIMRSNGTVRVSQKAVFIGCSNRTLAELISDATGMRRFVELPFKDRADWDVLNKIDWKMLWQSVDEAGPDPSVPFKDYLLAQQEANRDVPSVEVWANSDDGLLCGQDDTSASDVHKIFREWEDVHFPKSKTSLVVFGRKMNELKRQAEKAEKYFNWDIRRNAQSIVYEFKKKGRDNGEWQKRTRKALQD